MATACSLVPKASKPVNSPKRFPLVQRKERCGCSLTSEPLRNDDIDIAIAIAGFAETANRYWIALRSSVRAAIA